MGISVNGKATDAPAVLVAEEVPMIKLQLRRINRLQRVNGPCYEIEKIYQFTKPVADILLQEVEEDGTPIWGVYRPKTRRAAHPGDEPAQGLDISSTFTTLTETQQGKVQAGGVEIGTEEELAELNLPQDGDTDSGEAVVV